MKKFSEMSNSELRRCGADSVGIAMGIQINHNDVTLLESSSSVLWFRIGLMYFDLYIRNDGTTSLYMGTEKEDNAALLAKFDTDGSLLKGVTE